MTTKMQRIEQERGRPMKVLLKELYRKHGGIMQVANELGVSQGTVSLWLMKLGLEIKSEIVEREIVK